MPLLSLGGRAPVRPPSKYAPEWLKCRGLVCFSICKMFAVTVIPVAQSESSHSQLRHVAEYRAAASSL